MYRLVTGVWANRLFVGVKPTVQHMNCRPSQGDLEMKGPRVVSIKTCSERKN